MNCLGRGLAALGGLWAVAFVHAAEIPQMEQAFNEPSVWNLTPDEAMSRWSPLGFEWTEQTRSDLRWFMPKQMVQDGQPVASPSRGLPPVEVLGVRPVDVTFKFQDNRLVGMMSMFYSRGDSGGTDMSNFVGLAKSLAGKIDVWAGAKGVAQRGDSRGDGATIDRMIWRRESLRLDLEWGYTRMTGNTWRPEFVRLRFVKYDPAQQAQLMGGHAAHGNVTSGGNAPEGMTGALQMKKRVEARANGDRVLAVPMVDQGPKGYCVAAVLERVARFYGREFDQHEAAQLANTSAEGGTTSEKLVATLRKMAGLMKMRCVGRTDMDDTTSVLDKKRRIELTIPKEFAEMLKDYNKEAKKAGKPEYDVWAAMEDGGVVAVYKKLDKDIYRKVRLAQRVEVEKFQRDLVKYLDAGAPVIWSVLMGIVPEPKIVGDDQMIGHMRMIIGHNLKTREILYSDTWGPGHEEKRMSMDDAWVINRGYFVVTPQNVRL